jgi:hypothetical protein
MRTPLNLTISGVIETESSNRTFCQRRQIDERRSPNVLATRIEALDNRFHQDSLLGFGR